MYDGHSFDSIRERQRYQELKLLEKAGKICNLELQKVYLLQPAFTDWSGKHQRAISYIADFKYIDNELMREVIEDAKGHRTQEYIIKSKIFMYNNRDLIFKEV